MFPTFSFTWSRSNFFSPSVVLSIRYNDNIDIRQAARRMYHVVTKPPHCKGIKTEYEGMKGGNISVGKRRVRSVRFDLSAPLTRTFQTQQPILASQTSLRDYCSAPVRNLWAPDLCACANGLHTVREIKLYHAWRNRGRGVVGVGAQHSGTRPVENAVVNGSDSPRDHTRHSSRLR